MREIVEKLETIVGEVGEKADTINMGCDHGTAVWRKGKSTLIVLEVELARDGTSMKYHLFTNKGLYNEEELTEANLPKLIKEVLTRKRGSQ